RGTNNRHITTGPNGDGGAGGHRRGRATLVLRRLGYAPGMCRSIRTLRHQDDAATTGEVEAAARQYVRKVSGFRSPSARNSAASACAVAVRAGDRERAPAPLDPVLPTRHVTSTKVVAVRGAELEVRDDLVVGEEPLEIRAAGPRQAPVQVAVTMRTPGQEDELALGFLTSEGLLADNEVTGVAYGDPGSMAEPDDSVLVRLRRRFDPSLAAKRNFVATASC